MDGVIYKILSEDFMRLDHTLADMRDKGFIQRPESRLRDGNQEEYIFRYSSSKDGELWIGNQFKSFEFGRHCTLRGLRILGSEDLIKSLKEEVERRSGIKLMLVTYL